jgi:penicillin-binding protein 1A
MNTEFGGGPVDGGTFPAEIWGDYMKHAIGKYCGDFKPPTEPFVSQPFFGHYATTGRQDASKDGSTQNGTNNGADQGTKPGTGAANGNGGGNTTGGNTYDPSQYETPPQRAPGAKSPGTTNATGDGTPP